MHEKHAESMGWDIPNSCTMTSHTCVTCVSMSNHSCHWVAQVCPGWYYRNLSANSVCFLIMIIPLCVFDILCVCGSSFVMLNRWFNMEQTTLNIVMMMKFCGFFLAYFGLPQRRPIRKQNLCISLSWHYAKSTTIVFHSQKFKPWHIFTWLITTGSQI